MASGVFCLREGLIWSQLTVGVRGGTAGCGRGFTHEPVDFPLCSKVAGNVSASEMGAGSNTDDKAQEATACSRRRPGKDEETREGGRRRPGGQEAEKESMMMELTRLVQKTVKESGWWEKRGIDCSILAAAFCCLPPGRTSTSAL